MDSASVQETKQEAQHREFVEIIKSSTTPEKKFVEETGVPAKIVYYCQDCEKLTVPKRIGKKLKFKCGVCDKENVSFGTEESIYSYYDIKKTEETEK
jgi:hypothetical protein